MARYLAHRQASFANSRIEDHCGLAAVKDFLENDEMIQIPVEDAGDLQFAKLMQLKAQWARRKTKGCGMRNQVLKGCAFEADREAPAQICQFMMQAMGTANHRQTS
ncbi:hypothetical protein AT984_19780 [Paucibacter sp. KCTC 42545]|nr:hypothetical protein AT984_19780 [Paucibacter sp. KCTC 42545]